MASHIIELATNYKMEPAGGLHRYAITVDGKHAVYLQGVWVSRMYELLQGKGNRLNCYQGVNFVLRGTTRFDGEGSRHMLPKGKELPYAEVTGTTPVPMGIQWLTKNKEGPYKDFAPDHLHSAVLLTTGREQDAILFEIPGYEFAARLTTLADVHAREMDKENEYISVHRHFYRE